MSTASQTRLANVGRILFAIVLLPFGLSHFSMAEKAPEMLPAFLPFPLFWVYFSGVALVAAALCIAFNRMVRPACFGFAAFLVLVIGMIHVPMLMAGVDTIHTVGNLLRDIALLGASLFIAAESQN